MNVYINKDISKKLIFRRYGRDEDMMIQIGYS